MNLKRRVDMLSPRKRQIFFMLFENIPLKEVSARLSLSKQAIDAYSHQIYDYFGTDTRIGLVLVVLKETKGLPPLDTWKQEWYDIETEKNNAKEISHREGKIRTTAATGISS